MSNNTDFRESFKGSSLLGGVQFYTIIISILRSKLTAVLLGPYGFGLLGIYTSTIDFIYNLSHFGLSTSAVRELSEANVNSNKERLSYVTSVFQNLVWITGSLGMLLLLICSPLVSYITFNDFSYIPIFCILSLTILLRQLSDGQNALLQGIRHLRFLALSKFWGSSIGLFTIFPIYYFWGINGIAVGIIFTYFINFLVSYYYSHKVAIKRISINLVDSIKDGRSMVRLGFVLALNGLFATFISYALRVLIGQKGGMEAVGLYTAGFAIINTYVGMVFTAMGTEYLPRISGYQNNKKKFIESINNQMEVAILLMAPMICLFLIFSRIGIILLYSDKFLEIEDMIFWAILAIIFKGPSWCCSYAIIAKGDSMTFFINEIVALAYTFILNYILYLLLGLNGLGISYLLIYVIYFFQEWAVCYTKYGFVILKGTVVTFSPHVIMCLLCAIVVLFDNHLLRYVLGSALVVTDIIIAYKQLNKRLDIISIVKKKKHDLQRKKV